MRGGGAMVVQWLQGSGGSGRWQGSVHAGGAHEQWCGAGLAGRGSGVSGRGSRSAGRATLETSVVVTSNMAINGHMFKHVAIYGCKWLWVSKGSSFHKSNVFKIWPRKNGAI